MIGKITINYRRWLLDALFTCGVAAIAVAWIYVGEQPAGLFAAWFAFCLLAARYAASTVRQRYRLGALALLSIVAGQILCPLDYYALQHIVFNVPFLSAYLFPSIWAGGLLGVVFCALLLQTAAKMSVPVDFFWGPLTGIVLLPLICHSLAYMIHQLMTERQELRHTNLQLHNEIAEKRKIAAELYASAAELASKNTALTLALDTIEQTQKQMLQQEKMASIGQLAAGIAHEINNPLGFVNANIGMLEQYFAACGDALAAYRRLLAELAASGDPAAQEAAATAAQSEQNRALERVLADFPVLFADTVQGLERINKIVKGLRHFSHTGQERAFGPYDLIEGLENTLLIAKNEIKHFAAVEKNLGSLPAIEAAGGEINQVLLNILVNAAQAIRAKGNGWPGLIRVSAWCDETAVYCAIADNGVGIARQNLGSVFNPFFTTKPFGAGTGLGLSISYNIVVNHHRGKIAVQSVEGEGTTFTVTLPLRQPSESGGVAAGPDRLKAAAGG